MKKTVLSALSLCLALVLLLAAMAVLASCGGGKYDGTYVSEGGNLKLQLKGSEWTFYSYGEVTRGGTFEEGENGKITFYYMEDGERKKWSGATMKEDRIMVNIWGEFYREDKLPPGTISIG
ncbi:MAG: hypothetical protein J1E00_07485 [Oscillospiraceae bacterium]|nr:hypothetical protein [Oscillospiraceae bacterium]